MSKKSTTGNWKSLKEIVSKNIYVPPMCQYRNGWHSEQTTEWFSGIER